MLCEKTKLRPVKYFAIVPYGQGRCTILTFLSLIPLLFILLTAGQSDAQISVFPSTPDWTSDALGSYSTGLGVADINQDGWNDIIVANGNDMARQHLVVYYNNGDGTYPLSPSWSSADVDYHGHLAVGDINQDGYPDVAVSVYIGPSGFSQAGRVKVYFNQGGTLESTPSFQSADNMYTFSCALGDADGDGDLDLGVACGEGYNSIYENARIYFNVNGSLNTFPGWISSSTMIAMDVEFADMDGNGYLDMIVACSHTANYIYLSDSSGVISSHPSWNSQDTSYYANSLAIADVDSNEFPDLIISDNSQISGGTKFYKTYFFDAAPTGQSMPGWYSQNIQYASAVIAEDLTGDGKVDLLGGRWWGQILLFPGTGSSFNTSYEWASGTNSVNEAFALRDVDKDGYFAANDTIDVTRDSIHVVYLRNQAVENILSVGLNGQPLAAGTDFCTIPGGQWISIRQALRSGDQVTVHYSYSRDRDLLVTNWDSGIGNYLFYNRTNPPTFIANREVVLPHTMIAVYPNPFNQQCTFRVELQKTGDVELNIYDVAGRLVQNIFRGEVAAGIHTLTWNGKNENGVDACSGMYFYRIQTGQKMTAGKLLLAR